MEVPDFKAVSKQTTEHPHFAQMKGDFMQN